MKSLMHYIFQFTAGICLLFGPIVLIGLSQTVSITPFAFVATNTAAGVEVITSPPSQLTVTLALRNLYGSGAATFATNGGTSLTITQSCVVDITGTQSSSSASNMVMEAYIESAQVCSNIFSVITNNIISIQAALDTAWLAVSNYSIATNAARSASLKGTNVFVTFGSDLPPDALGPGFVAGVELNAFTGQVVNILSGP